METNSSELTPPQKKKIHIPTLLLSATTFLSTTAAICLFWQNQILLKNNESLQNLQNNPRNVIRQAQQYEENGIVTPPPQPHTSPTPINTPTPASDDTPVIKQKSQTIPADWKKYTNNDVGLTLSYPSDMKVISDDQPSADPTAPLSLVICVEPRMDGQEALKTKYPGTCRILDGGWNSFGEEKSKAYYEIGSMKARSQTVLSMFEVCSVMFTRTLSLDKNQFHVEISVTANADSMIPSIQKYLITDKANCQDSKIWNFQTNSKSQFYADVSNGKIPGIPKEWYDSFDKIISTIRI